MQNKKTDILILGSGIAGYETFRTLNKLFEKNDIGKKITLIDKNNFFTFTPMLHEVASGSVQPNHCAIPMRQCLYKTSHEFWKTEVMHIDPSKKIVTTKHGEISYQSCVVALGSKVNFLDIPGAEEFSFHVRTLKAAMRLHQKFMHLLEDQNMQEINMAIVGGGATGVELAGQFCHLVKHDIRELYPEKKVNLTIINSGDSLLTSYNEDVQKKVLARLRSCNVEILLNSRVSEVTKSTIILEDGKEIKSDLTAWTGGFAAIGPCYLDAQYCEKGQILVNEYLQSQKEDSLYAVGDIALNVNNIYPKLGEIAHVQGVHVAKEIVAKILNKKHQAFNYEVKGFLIPIGDWWAYAKIGPFKFHGRFAWWIRRTVYLFFMPGFLRKLRIVLDWTLHSLGFRHMVEIEF